LLIKGLKGLFGFLTILPIGMESMEALSKYFFLCPIVGLVIGLIAGISGFMLSFVLPELICGFLVLAVIQLLTGFHHLDGLLDFSDAAMARGDIKRRIEVMHDMYTGAAAVVVSVIVLTTTGLAFGNFSGLDILKVAIVSEIIAKESMLIMAYVGKKPSYEGSGFYVVEAMENKHVKILASLALSIIIGFILIGFMFVFVFVCMVIASYFLTIYSNRTLECVTGDVMGATNEINRMLALIAILAFV
jgi:adenosylcobinamide-GDP ribazoletransferase